MIVSDRQQHQMIQSGLNLGKGIRKDLSNSREFFAGLPMPDCSFAP